MMKKIYKWSNFLFLLSLLFIACDSVLDKSDLSAINEEDIWSDETLSQGFLNEIYDRGLSGWPIAASQVSDDAEGAGGTIYGELNSNSRGQYGGNYRNIKDINLLLEKVEAGGLDVNFQSLLKSQALFFRAKMYFDLVLTYGGVPLVLKVPVQGVDELELSRNKTSECIAQILSDLDNAISNLPNVYDDSADYGRITKGAAMAFKAKVLVFYASEQFDPTSSGSGRWQDAYTAILAAKTNLEASGKGLHSSYADLWFEESASNPEAIIVRQYNTDRTHNRDSGCRPFVTGTNGESWDKPTISHANAYPMKDGKHITDLSSAYTYDSDVFWVNRDPRFMANIGFNGVNFPLNDPEPISTSDLVWTFQRSQVEAQSDSRISHSAMLCRKAIDGSIAGGNPTLNSPTDWLELRFTEVVLFLAEAANEIGKTAEAYNVLQDIRARAGIDVGGGLYGLQAGMSMDQMREAIMLERRIELAFEGKRSSDLRRRRMYSTINGSIRRGYVVEKTAAFDALDPSDQILDDRVALEMGVLDGSIDLSNPVVYNSYFTTQVRSLERDGNLLDDGTPINYDDKYYFFDLPQSALDKNPNLEQTSGWDGGNFNPLD